MSSLIDIIIIAVLVLFLVFGYRKGLIKSVMGLVSLIASVIVAINFYMYPAAFIKENYVQPYFVKSASGTFSSLMNGGTETIPPEKIFEDKPDALYEVTEKFNIDIDSLKSFYENSIKPTADMLKIDEISDKLSNFTVESTVGTVSNVLGFIVMFLSSVIAINLLLMLLNLMFKLPVLKFANKCAGGFLGLIKGLLTAVLILNILAVLASATGDDGTGFWSNASLQSSYSYKTAQSAGLIFINNQ